MIEPHDANAGVGFGHIHKGLGGLAQHLDPFAAIARIRRHRARLVQHQAHADRGPRDGVGADRHDPLLGRLNAAHRDRSHIARSCRGPRIGEPDLRLAPGANPRSRENRLRPIQQRKRTCWAADHLKCQIVKAKAFPGNSPRRHITLWNVVKHQRRRQ